MSEIEIVFAVFGIICIAGIVTLLIRIIGKKNNIDTKDIEQGIEQGKDTAVHKLNEMKK